MKKVLITGGTRGIGFAIAEKLISENYDVYVTGTSNKNAIPQNSKLIVVDFLQEKSTYDFLEKVRLLDFDILVNNAGINRIGNFSTIPIKDFDDILNVNLRVPFMLCQIVLENMLKNKWGRIVNISSIFGHITKEYRASYSASKFGLDGMTAALAAEVAQSGVLANSIAPGFIDTELTRDILGAEGIKILENRIPIKRMGSVKEVANLAAWLVSKDNSYISGQNIIVDGGFSRV